MACLLIVIKLLMEVTESVIKNRNLKQTSFCFRKSAIDFVKFRWKVVNCFRVKFASRATQVQESLPIFFNLRDSLPRMQSENMEIIILTHWNVTRMIKTCWFITFNATSTVYFEQRTFGPLTDRNNFLWWL